MAEEVYKIRVEVENGLTAQQGTRTLADNLREVSGVLGVERGKEDASTMDLGTIITVLASSGATLAIAQGIADWIRRTRGVHVTIERDEKSGSIKAEVENIDQATSVRILEIIRGT
jgi:Effector Associated Constant Component 1